MIASTRFIRVRNGNAAVVLAAAAFACVPPTPVRPKSPATTLLTPIGGSAGFTMGRRCNATGVETCFNAVDDNCNGLVDEGCGLATGVLQLVIAWDSANADVDLEVTDPLGQKAEVGRVTATGLTKDRDCPGDADECVGQNFEVVTCLSDVLVSGKYRIALLLNRSDPDVPVVRVQIGGHVGQDPLSGQVELSSARRQISVELKHSPLAGPASAE